MRLWDAVIAEPDTRVRDSKKPFPEFWNRSKPIQSNLQLARNPLDGGNPTTADNRIFQGAVTPGMLDDPGSIAAHRRDSGSRILGVLQHSSDFEAVGSDLDSLCR